MVRWAYLLTAFVALAAWAGAQGPAPAAPLSAEDKLRLLKANSALIDNLVDNGVALSGTTDPVLRAERCRASARSLVNAIQEAARADDAERVAELTGLFRAVALDGLAPVLAEARQNMAPESPGAVRLRKVRDDSVDDLKDLKDAAASTRKLSDSPRVKDALKQLDDLTDAFK